MLLAGCLSYSNSAMNPILYAFLSENFKKSFLKACTCTKRLKIDAFFQLKFSHSQTPYLSSRRDANAALQVIEKPQRRSIGKMGPSEAKNNLQVY